MVPFGVRQKGIEEIFRISWNVVIICLLQSDWFSLHTQLNKGCREFI